MHEFTKSNLISGILWLKSSIDRLTFTIKTKPREGTVTFPKYNEYINISSSETQVQKLTVTETNEISEYNYHWQKKVFSRWELNLYTDIDNCISEREKYYNNIIQNDDYKVSRMFTYTDKEGTLVMPKIDKDMKKNKNNAFKMLPCFSKVNSNLSEDYISSSTRHLFHSEQEKDGQWETMYIVWDNSEYNEDNQLLFKEECVLLSLYYNTTTGCLLVSPNENDLDHNPYSVVTESGVLGFEYSFDIKHEEDEDEELVKLLRKLNTKIERKQKSIISFQMPQTGTNKTIMHFEIVSAKAFDGDNIYIEFTVKIPEEIQCSGDVHGRTHVSKAIETQEREWKFGHTLDLEMEYASGLDPPPIVVYLEAISTDWWSRHRTEGYSYVSLPVEQGRYSQSLPCRRPEEFDWREAQRRRFFVGECHLIKDLNVLDHPQNFDINFRYITTGDISVRWDAVTQTQSPGTVPSASHSASQLLRGADDVLRHYKLAKATLASATGDLDVVYGSGDPIE